MNKLPIQCPSCESELHVNRLSCKSCHTEVNGKFNLPILSSLTTEEQFFVLGFMKASGSLKIMAQKMNLSYPTVRNILDGIIQKITALEKQNSEKDEMAN